MHYNRANSGLNRAISSMQHNSDCGAHLVTIRDKSDVLWSLMDDSMMNVCSAEYSSKCSNAL